MCTINFLVQFLAISALNLQKCMAVKIYGSFKVVVECIPAHCIGRLSTDMLAYNILAPSFLPSLPGEFYYLSCHHLCSSLWCVSGWVYHHWSCLWTTHLGGSCHCCSCVGGCCDVQIPRQEDTLLVSSSMMTLLWRRYSFTECCSCTCCRRYRVRLGNTQESLNLTGQAFLEEEA